MSRFGTRGFLAICLFVLTAAVGAEPRRRALLVGINDYSAPRQALKAVPVEGRDFPNLEGAVNDVELMQDILVSVYQFKPGEIVTLKNQQASRAAIFDAIDGYLIKDAQKGDVLLFYFSGHGSQVRNSLSEEDDRLDESIVPADTRRGVVDIRDKDLRRRFLPVLDGGARLTIILDSCHSGSGARGLPGGGQARFGPPDTRDVKDGYRGPKLEDGGALILSAARDTDLAFETRGDREKLQGVFSWAWARAVRDAALDEPAFDTFQRAAARMSLEKPDQVPVIAGNAEARYAPFLGTRKDRQSDRVIVGVRSVEPNGVVTIHGGWANGLTLGSELRPVMDPPSDARLEVTALDGVKGCTARIRRGSVSALHSGSLLELVAWAAPKDRPLRVWVPLGDARTLTFAHTLADTAKKAGLEWLEDPTAGRPEQFVRWDGEGWESLGADRRETKLGATPDASAALGSLSRGMSLFVQVPASADIGRRIAPKGGVERVKGPQDADYILTGRLSQGRLSQGRVEYAWIHPSVDGRDQGQNTLPLRTDWHDGGNAAELAALLNEDLRRLQRIHLWQTVPSPPATRFNYRLGIRRTRDDALIADRTLIAEEEYGFVLRAAPGPRELSTPRFVYVFMVDSYGKSVLFFPRGPIGSVENRFPIPTTAPPEIRLGADALVIPEAPFGTDTYFLLSTDTALTDPWILEWDGVRTPKEERGGTPLEQLLLLMMSGDRGARFVPTPSRWSIERLSYVSTQGPAASNAPAEASQ